MSLLSQVVLALQSPQPLLLRPARRFCQPCQSGAREEETLHMLFWFALSELGVYQSNHGSLRLEEGCGLLQGTCNQCFGWTQTCVGWRKQVAATLCPAHSEGFAGAALLSAGEPSGLYPTSCIFRY